MYRHVTATMLALALVPLAASAALSQDRLDLSSALELNIHGGSMGLDQLDAWEIHGGGNALVHLGSGFGLGATVDWVRTKVDVGDDEEEDATFWYYNAELQYALPSVTRAQFYGVFGVGVSRYDASEELEEAGVEGDTNLMVPIGLGVRWLNRKVDPSWGATFDVRDRIVYIEDDRVDTSISSDWSIAIGLSLILGG